MLSSLTPRDLDLLVGNGKGKDHQRLAEACPIQFQTQIQPDFRRPSNRSALASGFNMGYNCPHRHVQNVCSILFTVHMGIEEILETTSLCLDWNIH